MQVDGLYTRKLVHPGDEISVEVPFHPRRLGNRTVMATFCADEIAGVKGEVTVFVVSKSEWEEKEEEEMDVADGDKPGETNADGDKAGEVTDDGDKLGEATSDSDNAREATGGEDRETSGGGGEATVDTGAAGEGAGN